MPHDPLLRMFDSIPVSEEQQARIDVLRAGFVELGKLVMESDLCQYEPQVHVAMAKLLEAKDAAVRAVVFSRGW